VPLYFIHRSIFASNCALDLPIIIVTFSNCWEQPLFPFSLCRL